MAPWDGSDRDVRRLRILSTVVLVALLAVVVLGPVDSPTELGAVVGALLVVLGFAQHDPEPDE